MEALAHELSLLVCEREELRARGASSTVLENNRRAIVERQHELCRALIERYAKRGPTAEATEAPAGEPEPGGNGATEASR